jgi:hypothetical protein
MRYKNKNDIKYKDFIEFSKEIEGKSDIEIAEITMYYFFKNSKPSVELLNQFSNSLEAPYRINVNIDIDINSIGRFIDVDNYLKDQNITELLKILVKPKLFRGFNIDNVSLAVVETMLIKATEAIMIVKSNFEGIFNPPLTINLEENTEKSLAMAEFTEHYGGYMELTYMLLAGDFLKYEKLMNMKTEEFLFFGEYLLRKRNIENLK